MHKTKVYVIFHSSGLGHRGSWDSSDIKQKVMMNEEILEELEKRCEGVEFTGRINLIDEERMDLVSRSHYGITEEEKKFQVETSNITRKRAEFALKNIRNLRESLDGILIFGPPSDELVSIGLPIISVFPMWGTWMASFDFKKYKEKKILFSFLPVVKDSSESIFLSRIEDIVKKIKLIQAISKMKKLKVLDITDKPVLGSFESTRSGVDRADYEKLYLDNLERTLGTELIVIPQEELFYKIQEIKEKKAEEIAKIWIKGAKEIKDTNETEILKSAKVYLAMKELMEKYECGAITTEGYGVFADYEKGPIPSQGLASSQFCTEGIIATSECLINSLITQQLGFYITNRQSFNGDYIIDPFNNIAIIGHCECPLNVYGDEKKCSYTIRNLPRWRKNEGGACIQVDLPLNETVTVVRISMYDKKISVFTGKTTSGKEIFNEWDNLACRTKVAIKTNTEMLLKNIDWQTFGVHRVVFYGDFRKEIKNLATLIGFEVIEEDK